MKKPYSIHKFMFPFRFDYIPSQAEAKDKYIFYRDNPFSQRVDLKRLYHRLCANGWRYNPFTIKQATDYNQYVYFYDFVKDALYNTSEEFEEGATSYYFEHGHLKDTNYTIELKDGPIYELLLKRISLKVFDTGVGILTFHLENHDYPYLQDVLRINDYGRRIYPQFLEDGFSLEEPCKAFLPCAIELDGVREDFSSWNEDSLIGKPSLKVAKHILEVLGEAFTIDLESKERFLIQPVIDDRMFVVCWFGSDAVSEIVKRDIYSDVWYRYVFVDGNSKTVADEAMQKDLIDQTTYRRWMGIGTLYGVTRYSFVALSKRDWFGENVLLMHMETIYYQMALLLLAQRASLLRFADEITAVSDIERKKEQQKSRPTTEVIEDLYKNYLRFVNKLYFKEITPQEQGIEMYALGQRNMNIDRDIHDLQREIATINSYAFFKEEKEEKEQMNKLTKLGTIFLPPTLVAGIFGMNVFPNGWIDNIGGLLFSLCAIGCFTWWIAKMQKIDILEFFTSKDRR